MKFGYNRSSVSERSFENVDGRMMDGQRSLSILHIKTPGASSIGELKIERAIKCKITAQFTNINI